ncbi:MAG: diphthine--ammonia ligase [Candidatus Nanoarchaeia archaeon]
MKVGVLYTGGKDSTFATWRVMQQGREIACLIILLPEDSYSYMYHTANMSWVQKLHPKALGVPAICQKTKSGKENEFNALKKALQAAIKKYNIQGVVSGANASEYQQYKLEALCADLGLRSIAPLWHVDPETYLTEIINSNFELIFTSVSTEGMGDAWLGRKLDNAALNDLHALYSKFGININGEGGEYETMVLDGPLFKSKIEILDAEKVWFGDHGVYKIKDAKLIKKSK